MIAIVDYGMGNLRSVYNAFSFLGFNARVTSEAAVIKNASHLVLPGVGAFGDAMKSLESLGLVEPVYGFAKSGKPVLGICLGMQLMLDKSLEHGEHAGLGLIPGAALPFDFGENEGRLKVPQIGWNSVENVRGGLIPPSGAYVYFVHSYHAWDVPDEYVLATTRYGYGFASAIGRDNLAAVQFHPEKSGETGLKMLERFARSKF